MKKRASTLTIFTILATVFLIALLTLLVTYFVPYLPALQKSCLAVLNYVSSTSQIEIHLASKTAIALIMLIGMLQVSGHLFKFVVARWYESRQDQTEEQHIVITKIIAKHHLPKKMIRVVNQPLLAAYTFGIFHPRIVVSNQLLKRTSYSELEAIILHEWFHVQQHHVLKLLLVRVTSSLLYFVPLFTFLGTKLRTEFEIAADAFVVQTQRTSRHLRTSLALELGVKGESFQHFATTPIEQRITTLLGQNAPKAFPSFWKLGMSVLSALIIMGLLMIQPTYSTASLPAVLQCETAFSCEQIDCSDSVPDTSRKFSPFVPASIQLSFSH